LIEHESVQIEQMSIVVCFVTKECTRGERGPNRGEIELRVDLLKPCQVKGKNMVNASTEFPEGST
jgi:hypothetical protein